MQEKTKSEIIREKRQQLVEQIKKSYELVDRKVWEVPEPKYELEPVETEEERERTLEAIAREIKTRVKKAKEEIFEQPELDGHFKAGF